MYNLWTYSDIKYEIKKYSKQPILHIHCQDRLRSQKYFMTTSQ